MWSPRYSWTYPDYGRDAYALDRRGRTALHACVIVRGEDMAEGGKVHCVNLLWDGSILDWADEAGATALHLASDCGAHEIVLTLLQTAWPELIGQNGTNSPHSSTACKSNSCMKILMEYGGMDEVALTTSALGAKRDGNTSGSHHYSIIPCIAPEFTLWNTTTTSGISCLACDWVKCHDEASGRVYWLDD